MKITKLEVEEGHREVFEDPLTEQIVEAVHARRSLLAFVATVLRDFYDGDSLTARDPSLRRLARTVERDKSERKAIDRICTAIEQLYRKFEPSTVRGTVVEALVQRSIQARYGGAQDTLENNLKFKVESGSGASHETSTSIDVIGVCSTANEGECIDCKVASKKFKAAWIEELINDVSPFGLRIALATADSRDRARHGLRRAGIGLEGKAVLVTPDSWWSALPLLQPLVP